MGSLKLLSIDREGAGVASRAPVTLKFTRADEDVSKTGYLENKKEVA